MSKKTSVALSSVFASAAMTIGKFTVGILTGSMGIISEAAHSAVDLGAAGLTLYSVKASDRPADADHPYGHGKIESVSALIETGLLFLTSAWIVYEAVSRIIAKNVAVETRWYAFVLIIISIGIDISRSRALSKVAKETSSQALEADALHFNSDIWSSGVVLIGLIFVAFGIKGADAIAAIGVSIFVLVAGYRLGKRTINVLIDTAPEGISDIVEKAVCNIEGVVGVEKIRVRPLGPSIFIEIEICISRGYSVVKADEVVKKAKSAVHQKVAGADIVIHTRPIQLKDETMVDVIRTTAFKHALSVHDIVVDILNGKKYISYDLELPGNLTVFEAHETASHLENEIQSELGPDVELSTHIDPLAFGELVGDKLTDQEINLIKQAIDELILKVGIIGGAHDILLRKIDGKILATFHCYTNADETLEVSHRAASKLKSLLREKIPTVGRVVVHVEPKA